MTEEYEKPSTEVSERMRKVKSKNTGLEQAMEKLLQELNIDFESQPKLRGRPDFRIKGTNILIFCDSSFWHGRREKDITGEAFKRNKEFWTKKIVENRKRDERTNRALRKEGWSVHRFWDDDILKRSDKVKKRLERVVGGKSRKETDSD